ncbi:MAG: CsbD-like protein [Xanthobacteraceae bacterium]|nr:MAG: CsbD-like protein [Xanthobacteraceae bacterium]
MGSTSDKIRGMANEAAGNVKQTVGKAIDNKEMQAKGKMQEIKGEAQQLKGDAKDAIKKVVDRA